MTLPSQSKLQRENTFTCNQEDLKELGPIFIPPASSETASAFILFCWQGEEGLPSDVFPEENWLYASGNHNDKVKGF